MYADASKALHTAKRRGDTRAVDYWSGQPITGIAVLPYDPFGIFNFEYLLTYPSSLSLVRLPIEKPISLLSQGSTGTGSIIAGVRDPFLYNPRKAAQGQVGALDLVI